MLTFYHKGTPRKSSGASDKSQTSISDHVEHLKAERRNAIIRQNIIYKTKSATFENEQIEARVKRDKLAVRDLDRITEARKAKLKAQEMIERQLKAIKEELQGFDTAEAELHDLMRKNQIDSHKEVMDYIRELAAQRTIKIEKVQERCLADLEEIAILGDGNVLEISSLLPLTEEDLSLTFKDKRCTNSRDTKDNEEENDKTVSDVPGLSRSPAQVAHNSGGEHEGTSMEIDDYDNPTTPVSTDPMATNISQRFRGITEGSSPPMQRKLASPFEARDNVKQAGRDSVKDTKKRKIEALLTNPSKRARSTQASPNAPVAIMKQFSKKTSNNMESGQWSDSNYGDAFPLTHLRCGNQTWTLRENLSYRQHVSSYRIEVFKDKTLCLSSFHANLIFTPSSVSEVAFGGGKTVEHDDMTIIVTKNDAQATKIHMVFQKRSDVERMAWAIVKINPMAGMDVKDG